MMDEKETSILLSLCKEGGSALEIGTYKGATTSMLLRVADTVDTVDVLSIPETLSGGQKSSEVLPPDQIGSLIPSDLLPRCNRHLIDPSDNSGLRGVLEAASKTYDFILIDGDHSEFGVNRDYHTCLDYLSKDGIIVLHDCWWNQNPPSVLGPMSLLHRAGGVVINGSSIGSPHGSYQKISNLSLGNPL